MATVRRGTSGTLKKRARFLEVLRESANVRAACEAAGANRSTMYRWREELPAFAAEWDTAIEDAVQSLELVAWKRAVEMDSTLLMFLLKAHRPDMYRERVSQEHSGEQKLTIEYVNNWRSSSGAQVTDEEGADHHGSSNTLVH